MLKKRQHNDLITQWSTGHLSLPLISFLVFHLSCHLITPPEDSTTMKFIFDLNFFHNPLFSQCSCLLNVKSTTNFLLTYFKPVIKLFYWKQNKLTYLTLLSNHQNSTSSWATYNIPSGNQFQWTLKSQLSPAFLLLINHQNHEFLARRAGARL